jgi:hypothetical protein
MLLLTLNTPRQKPHCINYISGKINQNFIINPGLRGNIRIITYYIHKYLLYMCVFIALKQIKRTDYEKIRSHKLNRILFYVLNGTGNISRLFVVRIRWINSRRTGNAMMYNVLIYASILIDGSIDGRIVGILQFKVRSNPVRLPINESQRKEIRGISFREIVPKGFGRSLKTGEHIIELYAYK